MFSSSRGNGITVTSRLGEGPTRTRRRGPSQVIAGLGSDRCAVPVADLDLARLRLLQQRDANAQHAAVVRSADVVGVHPVGQPDSPRERAHDPLPDERLLAVAVLLGAL